jgi:serine/threonine protein phosphatase PrpC
MLGQSAVRTDPGRKRRHNEDSYVCEPPLFAIADGMGGARAGEVASALAAGALTESHANGGGTRLIVELIQEANRRVHQRASTDAETSGMGTTITVALVERDGSVTFGHVGDSRAYLLRNESLEQITDDHSLVAELVRRGELSAGEAEIHPQRSVITRALGTDPDVDVDAFSVEAEHGDVYLICSDGLSDMVGGEEIERILRDNRGDLDAAAQTLIQAANRAGGDDNITAILFEMVEGEQAAAPTEPDERTKEHARPVDEEDTLHPEDGVLPPPATEPATPPGPTPGGETDAEPPSPVDTMVVPAADINAALAAHEEEHAPQAGSPPQAGIGRRLLALLVIFALIAVIVVLVWWGLAR